MAWSSVVLDEMERPWCISLWKCINARLVAWTSAGDKKPKGARHLCKLYEANFVGRSECADPALVTDRELDALISETWKKEKATGKLGSDDQREVGPVVV